MKLLLLLSLFHTGVGDSGGGNLTDEEFRNLIRLSELQRRRRTPVDMLIDWSRRRRRRKDIDESLKDLRQNN